MFCEKFCKHMGVGSWSAQSYLSLDSLNPTILTLFFMEELFLHEVYEISAFKVTIHWLVRLEKIYFPKCFS